MSEIKLYTTHCPKCKVIETKLRQKGIKYSEITDQNELISRKITSVPMLEVDGKLLGFLEANKYVNSLTANEEGMIQG